MEKLNLIIGSMLHDIGKVIYRGSSDGRSYSVSGCDFLKESVENINTEILNCVRYHHSSEIKYAKLKNNDLAYITYIADNIASFIDRRKSNENESGFVKNKSFQSVFNILNGNNSKLNLSPCVLNSDGKINYPVESENNFNDDFYNKVKADFKSYLSNFELDINYANSLLSTLEGYLSYVPSSTNNSEYCDISLFDHLKITTAIACCLYDYLEENNISDYSSLYSDCESYYVKDFMLLYSLDISGIQKFIYTISSSGALKGLRARSFYLDMLLENSIDCLLESLNLSRSNLLYLGGGHGYLILPNTATVKAKLNDFERDLNNWFLAKYKTALYVASAYTACSPNNLRDKPSGSYSALFSNITKQISQKKVSRYSAAQIKSLNTVNANQNERECVVCGSTENLDAGNKCSLCHSLESISSKLIDNRSDNFFLILNKKPDFDCVELPFEQYLSVCDKVSALKVIQSSENYVRCYSKNKMYSGLNVSSKMWLGDYSSAPSFEALAKKCTGIKRLGVIRADIDNLGEAFVKGFDTNSVSISRTSTFSRNLSLFFKYYINGLLKNGSYQITNKTEKGRNATIVYSGGDDLFVVGAWDDIICFAVDLYNSLKKFTEGTLTISAGIGLFSDSFPIISMASQTGELEECSKYYDNSRKNAITLFEGSGKSTYHWDELIEKVLGEKYALLKSYFADNEESGKSMLYKMLQLIRDKDESNRLNVAKFAYLLARLSPKGKEKAEQYQEFSTKMYDWIQNSTDRRQLITAIYIYIYTTREKEN